MERTSITPYLPNRKLLAIQDYKREE